MIHNLVSRVSLGREEERPWERVVKCVLVAFVSGSRVAELEMHLLAAKVNYCTQQVADMLVTINTAL